jgi:predicted acyl esterase
VLLSHGPCAKGASFQTGYAATWDRLASGYPEVTRNTTNNYQNFEVADPERWVLHGYACVRVDSCGAGRSPGYVNPCSARETRDFHDCIEWAGTLPWSNGKVGLAGISYYEQNQWQVAATQPAHLAAMCIWEGSSDWCREVARHGGILCTFGEQWYEHVVAPVQYGRGTNGLTNPVTGQLASGDVTLDEATLAANRIDYAELIRTHVLDDDTTRERAPELDRVAVPLLSAANWGGQGLHLRGNVEGFLRAASRQKWLEVPDQPPLLLSIRHADGTFTRRTEASWPVPGTRFTTLYLDNDALAAEPGDAGQVGFDTSQGGVTFITEPLPHETEITRPLAARLFVSSSTTDADLFLVVRAFSPEGEEVVFQGALDSYSALSKGWLRASQRKLDPVRSTPYRPYHSHDETQPLTPGQTYQLDIDIWPTCVVLPRGYRVALSVQGANWKFPGVVNAGRLLNFAVPLQGSGPFQHNDPVDRPAEIFGGHTTVHTGADTASWLQLPIVGRAPGAASAETADLEAHYGGSKTLRAPAVSRSQRQTHGLRRRGERRRHRVRARQPHVVIPVAQRDAPPARAGPVGGLRPDRDGCVGQAAPVGSRPLPLRRTARTPVRALGRTGSG